MLFMKLFVFIGYESKMKFAFTEIIWFVAVTEPGEFQGEVTAAVTEIDQFERSICSILFANRFQVQRVFVEFQTFFQI